MNNEISRKLEGSRHERSCATLKSRWGLFALALSFLLLACGAPQPVAVASHSPSTAPAATQLSPTPSAKPVLRVAGSRYGDIIVDGSGRALYLFDIEREPVARCYDACASAWPPMRAANSALVADELDQSLLATIARRDGSWQVTYNRHPLYYYAGDRAPGEIKCQAVFEYGGGWYVVDPRGTKITRT
jgi:predicted lipoprotein with Yx(FWY)xxD motif